ncbi:MAG: hypothetical protein ACI9TH_001740 [Kiritimatiellia bacterium]|jgi:hypothetical protein
MPRDQQKPPKTADEAFNDILTCLAGILILIIILVVLDSKQTKILIPTPIEQESDYEPVYLEISARGQIFNIPVQELDALAMKKIADVASATNADQYKMLQQLSSESNRVGNADYEIDLLSKLTGNILLRSKPEAVGHIMPSNITEGTELEWYNGVLNSINKSNQYISFIVRSTDDSYRAFKKARALAWLSGVRVAYGLLENTEPIEFGFGGSTLNVQ